MLLFFLAGGGSGWLETYFNYPGLEAWKFLNLTIFTIAAIYILRRPINTALLARRDAIQKELVDATSARERALAGVAEADSLLSRLDDDVRLVHEQAQQEAESERQRQAAATAAEMEKLKLQAQRETDRAAKLARKQLRQFLAKRSVELARETVRTRMRPEDDTILIQESIAQLRRTTG